MKVRSFFCRKHKKPVKITPSRIRTMLKRFGYHHYSELSPILQNTQLLLQAEYQRGFRHGQAHETSDETVLNLLRAFNGPGRVLH